MDSQELRERLNAGQKDFSRANLRDAYLPGWPLGWVDLQGADLRKACLAGTELQWTDLTGAYLQGAYLQGANLEVANLQGANLQGAYLSGADLFNAKLQGANLQGADLRKADLRFAKLQGANLQGADLRKATFTLSATDSVGTHWAFDGTVWPTDPELLVGTTIDEVPFFEFMETLKAIGPNPSPEVRAAWDAMHAAKVERNAALAATINDPSPVADK